MESVPACIGQKAFKHSVQVCSLPQSASVSHNYISAQQEETRELKTSENIQIPNFFLWGDSVNH